MKHSLESQYDKHKWHSVTYKAVWTICRITISFCDNCIALSSKEIQWSKHTVSQKWLSENLNSPLERFLVSAFWNNRELQSEGCIRLSCIIWSSLQGYNKLLCGFRFSLAFWSYQCCASSTNLVFSKLELSSVRKLLQVGNTIHYSCCQ